MGTLSTGDERIQHMLNPSPLLASREVLVRPSPVPAAPGVYGWYFDEPPPGTAEELHRHYGKFVSLSVGALAYPPTTDKYESNQSSDPATTADPDELRAELDGPLSIKRGQTAVHHLHVTNLSNQSIEIHTNGNITATIIDPATGSTVGGYWGYQHLPLIIFTAAPAETVRIPLLVGTASFRPTLGYTVPSGTWGLLAPLHLGDGRRLLCGPMDLTITD